MTKIFQPANSLSIVPYIMKYGVTRDSERGATTELIGSSLTVRYPRRRLDTTRTRKMNPAFAFAEFIAMLSGIEDLAYFEQFIPSYGKYSSDGKVLDGAYGTRLVVDGRSQIDAIIDKLSGGLESRRAVAAIYDRQDLLKSAGGLNTPCTLNLQFLVDSQQRLHLVAYMRSSDIYLGLPNDIAAFTLLQEYVALKLNLPLGDYHHLAGSLHFYHEDGVQYKYEQAAEEGRWPYHMNPMTPAFDPDILRVVYENATNDRSLYALSSIDDVFTKDMALTGLIMVRRRTDLDHAKDMFNQVQCPTLRRVLRPWIVKE